MLASQPGDESVGCGGLIAACCRAGAAPFVVVLEDGAASHGPRRRRLREAETRAAVAALGMPAGRLAFLGLPDGALPLSGPAFEGAVTAVAALAIRVGAGAVLAPWAPLPDAHHPAHRVAARVAAEAGLPHWGYRMGVGPEAGGARFDVAAHLPAKRAAIACHASRLGWGVADDAGSGRIDAAVLRQADGPVETLWPAASG